mmetsp:Transcript_7279/g.13140  ORF Transcript_7279/g.13140 Transcript_7279/m.13140 type:complete len:242 (-) Transcript_7279:72-797(-)
MKSFVLCFVFVVCILNFIQNGVGAAVEDSVVVKTSSLEGGKLPRLILTAESASELKSKQGFDSAFVEPWVIQVTLKLAKSDSNVAFLKVFTPFESGIPTRGSLFKVVDITDASEPVLLPYEGALIKRGEPTFDDVSVLKNGDEISQEIDLSKGYQFKAGRKYSVEMNFNVKVQDVSMNHEDAFKTIDLKSFSTTSDVQLPAAVVFTATSESVPPYAQEGEHTHMRHARRVRRSAPSRRRAH